MPQSMMQKYSPAGQGNPMPGAARLGAQPVRPISKAPTISLSNNQIMAAVLLVIGIILVAVAIITW